MRYNRAVNGLKYKLIVSDFDGTLTDCNGNIPQENIAAIKAYRAAGGIFTVSTGRMHQSIIQKLDTLGLGGVSIPLVSYQGALIVDSKTKERLHAVEMEKETVQKILRFCESNRLYVHFYSFDRLYVKEYGEIAKMYVEYTDIKEYVTVAGNLEAYMDAHPELPICKVLIIDDADRVLETEKRINTHLNGAAVFSRASARLTECTDNKAGKGNAVRWFSQALGIPLKEIAAIGDAGNDASMLEAAGLGIAMGNAPEYLKKIADYVTDDNQNVGLAKAIYKILNNEL